MGTAPTRFQTGLERRLPGASRERRMPVTASPPGHDRPASQRAEPRQLSALAGGASPFACQYLARSGTLAQDDGGVARLGASIFLP